jgi:hypothetical protein
VKKAIRACYGATHDLIVEAFSLVAQKAFNNVTINGPELFLALAVIGAVCDLIKTGIDIGSAAGWWP